MTTAVVPGRTARAAWTCRGAGGRIASNPGTTAAGTKRTLTPQMIAACSTL
jgi:hypothetical protein